MKLFSTFLLILAAATACTKSSTTTTSSVSPISDMLPVVQDSLPSTLES